MKDIIIAIIAALGGVLAAYVTARVRPPDDEKDEDRK